MNIARILAIPLAAAALPAHGQDSDAQLWTSTTAEFEIAPGASLAGELVARFGDDANGLSEVQYQADTAFELSDSFSIGGGYSYVTRHEDGDVASREHRVRQQAEVGLGTLFGGEVEARLRVEQRWRDDGDDMLVRVRGRIAWTRPVGDGFAVRVWQESFVHANSADWSGRSRFARTRQQIGLRHDFAKSLTGELGYLSQFDFEDGNDRSVHALSLAVTLGF